MRESLMTGAASKEVLAIGGSGADWTLVQSGATALSRPAPKVVTITTGTPGSDYELFAERHQAIFRRSGVELRLIPSAGAVDNLARLNDRKFRVDVGFAQSGLTSDKSLTTREPLSRFRAA